MLEVVCLECCSRSVVIVMVFVEFSVQVLTCSCVSLTSSLVSTLDLLALCSLSV